MNLLMLVCTPKQRTTWSGHVAGIKEGNDVDNLRVKTLAFIYNSYYNALSK
jgi:hypothetical protein